MTYTSLGTWVQPIQVSPCGQDGARTPHYLPSCFAALLACSFPLSLSAPGRPAVLRVLCFQPCHPEGGIFTNAEAAHLDVRLVHPPGVVGGFEVGSAALLQFWCVVLDPAIDRGVIDLQPSFEHNLFQIAVAERIAQVPAHTQQNDVGLEMTPLERILALFAHEGDFFQVFLPHCSRSAFYLQHSRSSSSFSINAITCP